MNLAFGAGNWSDSRYETVNVGSLFSPGTNLIFMEGGDDNANELESFLTANSAAISAWVNAGGVLFVNSAPNEGDGMSMGFGVTLTYPDFVGDGTANAVNPLHPIFNGPFTPVGIAYTGTSFSHANVSGGGITSLIADGSGSTVLGSLVVGNGFALFGGMTTDNFHSPQPQSHNLLANILVFAAAQAQAVPEPASMLAWGLIVGVGGVGYRLRKRTAAVA